MKEDCRIAAVQMASAAGDIDFNITTILDMAREAAHSGANFIVFPEMALQGYSRRDAAHWAMSLEDPRLNTLSEAAQAWQAVLLVGLAEKAGVAKPYISHLAVLPDGRREVYRKVHLGRLEKEWFRAGDCFPVFESLGVKFAVGICWDWHFPEMAAIYSLKGAEILFAPHASPRLSGDRREIWRHYMRARAYDNSVYLAACNRSGTDEAGREYGGGAMVWGPKGDVLAETSNAKEPILYAELSAQRINALRTRERESMRDSFFLADRRKEVYRELLELEIL